MKKWSLLLSALVLCTALLPASAGEVLGVLEIRGIDNLATAAFDLTQATGEPVPRELVTMGLNGALGSPAGVGLEPNGTLRALWMTSAEETGSGAVLLPVQGDGTDYLTALGQSGWTSEEETDDGLMHFTAPAGQEGPLSDVYFLKSGSTLIAAKEAADARAAADALAGLPQILPAEGVVVLEIRPAALVQAFEPKIKETMDMAFRTAPGQTAETAAMMKLYVDAYIAAAKQIQEGVLGLGVANGNLNIHTRVAPVADSLLAKWLDTVGSPSPTATIVNLPGALFVETAHMGDIGLLASPYFQFVEQMLALMPEDIPAEAITKYMEGARLFWAQLAGDFGLALLSPEPGNPLRMTEYIALKDPAGLREITADMVNTAGKMMTSMMALDPSNPLEIEVAMGEPRMYRDIPVDRLTYRLEPGDELKAIWPVEGPLELSAELAWLPQGLAAAIGGPDITEMLVDRALDGTVSPVSDVASWQAAFPNPEPELLDLTHVAIFDGLRTYLQLLDNATGQDTAAAIPEGSGNLDSLSYMTMDGLMTRVRFGLDDIAAIALKIREAQEAAAAAYMQQMQMEMEAEGGMPVSFEPMDDAEYEVWMAEDDEELLGAEDELVEELDVTEVQVGISEKPAMDMDEEMEMDVAIEAPAMEVDEEIEAEVDAMDAPATEADKPVLE